MLRWASSAGRRELQRATTRRRWYSTETTSQNKLAPTLKSPLVISILAVGLGTAVYWMYEPDERTAKQAQALKMEVESKARAQEHKERKRREALGQQSVEETKAAAEARLRAAQAKYQAYKAGTLGTNAGHERMEESTTTAPSPTEYSKQSSKGWFGFGK